MPHSLLPPATSPTPHKAAAHKQIRGSLLLLIGRCLALGINLAVQIITVRYLAKEDYGAFAFGLAMAALGTNLSLLGLSKSLSRFVPMYHEVDDRPRMAGAIVLVFVSVLGLSAATLIFVHAAQALIAARVTSDPLSLSLLLMLIALVPLEALDSVFEALFAVFGSARSIFVRRYLLGPGLKLAAVLGAIAAGGSVYLLTAFYLVGSVLGVTFYAWLFVRILRQEELLAYFRPSRWRVPAADIYGFSLPLLSSQIGFVVKSSLAVLLLEMLQGSHEVAELRAVFPFARLNEVVLTSFSFLFTPLAARFFARGETKPIDHLYWRTSVWIVVCSLPAFLMTGVFARPFTVLMLGERYADASLPLAILALGFFVDAALGFNVHTLRVFGRVKLIVIIDLVTIAVAMGLCVALIPAWGALGAAVGICAATVVQNVLLQLAMWVSTGVGVLQGPYVRFYLGTVACIAVLALLQWRLEPSLLMSACASAVAYGLLLFASRPLLELQETFPELLRLPVIGRWFAPNAKPRLSSQPEGGA